MYYLSLVVIVRANLSGNLMMVYRDGDYFVPQGNTALKVGDKLLVISDRGEELESTYKDMGVDEVLKL